MPVHVRVIAGAMLQPICRLCQGFVYGREAACWLTLWTSPHGFIVISNTTPAQRKCRPRWKRSLKKDAGFVRTSLICRSPACAHSAWRHVYVSGYLRTLAPANRERLIGADASHAWVSIYCPGWIDLYLTNNLVPSTSHITLAWGRDYTDCQPRPRCHSRRRPARADRCSGRDLSRGKLNWFLAWDRNRRPLGFGSLWFALKTSAKR